MRKISVFGVFNKNINFSNESAKKPTIYDLLFLVAICSSKIDYKHLSEISTRTVTLLRFGTHFDDRSKTSIYHTSFSKQISTYKLSHKNAKVSQAQCNQCNFIPRHDLIYITT